MSLHGCQSSAFCQWSVFQLLKGLEVFHFVIPSHPSVIPGAQSTRHAVKWTRPLIKHGPRTNFIPKFYPNPPFFQLEGVVVAKSAKMKWEKPSRPSNTISYVTTRRFQHSVSRCGNCSTGDITIHNFTLSSKPSNKKEPCSLNGS